MDWDFLMVYSAIPDIQDDIKMLSLMLEISLSQVFADCEAFTYQQGWLREQWKNVAAWMEVC